MITWEPLDLLLTADELLAHRRHALAAGEWLDAYLLTAGLCQLVDDRLHPDLLQLRRAGDFLGTRALGLAARGVEFPGLVLHGRTLRAARKQLSEATIRLASVVLGDANPMPMAEIAIPPLPDVLRVPSCFRSFDQHPDDVCRLVDLYCKEFDETGPVCVVGVRTSGCYLAPLAAAALQSRGVPTVSLLSIRPGRPLHRDERQHLREVVAADGRVLMIDDPPVSGTALARAAQEICASGVPAERLTMLLALAAEEPPARLNEWDGIFQPWQEWTVHARLAPASVAAAMASLLGPGHQVRAERLAWPSQQVQRGRVRARYAVRITDPAGMTEQREIAVEGAGLGFFGRHAVTVATRLPEHCPKVYGLVEGLLYREWLPGNGDRSNERELAATVVRYVAARGQALGVRRDPTAGLQGRQPAWEVAAAVLSRPFGRLAALGQIALGDRLARNLLRVTAPCVTDGQTHTRYWPAGGQLRKVGFDERSFGNLELACYDEVFDLAGAAADPPSPGFEALLRSQCESLTGRTIDPERWLLYRLAHLWRLSRAGDLGRAAVGDYSAAAVHDFLVAVQDANGLDGGGDLCAIDLDGVLETDVLGFPCTTPLGVLALRALAVHGYRPVPVTGRSLPEVVARCNVFGLSGGVAEYGAAIYDRESGQQIDLRSAAERSTMAQLRARLAIQPGIEIDERYQHIVRARGVNGLIAADLYSLANESVRVIQGESQTDIVPARVDKGVGTRALSQLLGSEVAFAVGDSAEDLAMVPVAALVRAPRNADPAVRAAGVRLTRHAYQAGLAEACRDLLGHSPGGCELCRPRRRTTRSATVSAMLSLREDGLRGLPQRTARLTGPMIRSSRW